MFHFNLPSELFKMIYSFFFQLLKKNFLKSVTSNGLKNLDRFFVRGEGHVL